MSVSSKRVLSGGWTPVLFAMTTAGVVLSGCALDSQGDYRKVVQIAGEPNRPVLFEDAKAQCWAVSMNIAGFAATIPQLEAYKTCMMRSGWEDRRSLF